MNTQELLKNAFVATIYVVLTVFVVPHLSFTQVQFRISEILLILVLFNKKYWIGLLVGTFLSNLSSPLGAIDWIVGTGASAISIYWMLYFKDKLLLSLLMPCLINGLLVGLQLFIVFSIPLWISVSSVFFGEFVVVVLFGYLFYHVIQNNEGFKKVIQ